ncbi:hypothetical protein [Streptomyces microflavus]|uniref:Uncharacterized protein n=1 Tax=Streptomyces microflavus TaxID=1919 RepID=A0ABV1QBM4_STRMI
MIAALDLSTDDKKAHYGFDLGAASAADSPRYRLDGDHLIGQAHGTLTAKAGVLVRTVVTEKKGQEEHELETIETRPRTAESTRLAEELTASFGLTHA